MRLLQISPHNLIPNARIRPWHHNNSHNNHWRCSWNSGTISSSIITWNLQIFMNRKLEPWKKKKHDTKLKTNKFNLSRARSRDWQTHRRRSTTTTSSPGPMEHPRRSPHPPSPAAAASHRPPARRRRRRTSRRGGRTRPGGGRGGGGSRGRRRLRRRRRARKSAAWSEKVAGVESVSVGGERVGIQRFKSFKFSTTFSFFLFSTKFALTFWFFFFF